MKVKMLILVLSLFFPFAATASIPVCGGDAFIPSWQKRYIAGTQGSFLQFSNISDKTINVRIELKDADGNIYSESSETGTQITFNGTGLVGDPIATSSATLAPHSSANLFINNTGVNKFGYGTIQWASDLLGCSNKSMLATYIRYMGNSGRLSESQITINNGLPF